MSTGGVYQLIVNDGAQDKLLLATELLNKRLKEIRRLRCKHPAIRDSTPTLVDIERTHLLFINAHFKPFVAIGYEYDRTAPQQGSQIGFGRQLVYSIPQFGDFFHDMVIHFRLEGLAGQGGNYARYVSFLGHRLVRRVRFEVNGNFLDDYNSDVYNMHYQFGVPQGKKLGWQRCMGQEIPRPVTLVHNPGVDQYREIKYFVDGPQTPKAAHPSVDVWVPLLFWFNRDPRLSIPSVSIPYGQRFIYVDIAPLDQLCRAEPVNLFTPPRLVLADMYINNIFVNPEIHDIFIKRIGFNMIRVYRIQTTPVSENRGEIRLDQLKWPVETLYIGFRPAINDDFGANPNAFDDWHRYHSFGLPTNITFPVAVPNSVPPPAHLVAFSTAQLKDPVRTIDTIELQTHGIQIYREFPAGFYNDYIPLNYGSNTITTPDDIGAYMVTFNLYPGAYQPSGYINLSRSREFYLNYTSSAISPIAPANMVVVAVAINFLLVSDGSAVLRYNL